MKFLRRVAMASLLAAFLTAPAALHAAAAAPSRGAIAGLANSAPTLIDRLAAFVQQLWPGAAATQHPSRHHTDGGPGLDPSGTSAIHGSGPARNIDGGPGLDPSGTAAIHGRGPGGRITRGLGAGPNG